MIKNFEQVTADLNHDEKKIVPIIVKRFQNLKGKQNIVTNQQIIDGLYKHYNIKLTQPRVRKIIQYIRLNNLLAGLIATQGGYYYTTRESEIRDWIETMKQREAAIRASYQIAEEHLKMLRTKAQATITF
jgi:hypothetical protein